MGALHTAPLTINMLLSIYICIYTLSLTLLVDLGHKYDDGVRRGLVTLGAVGTLPP